MAKRGRTTLRSLDECSEALRKLGTAEIELERINGAADKQILAIRRQAAEQAGPWREDRDRLAAELEAYYEQHAEDLEADGRRTVELGVGRMGRRRAPARLETIGKLSWKKAVDRVKRVLGVGYIATEERVDKDAIHGAKLPAELLREAGLRLSHPERWWYEVDRTKLEALRRAG